MTKIFSLLCVLLLGGSVTLADYTTISNTEGKKIEVELLELKDDEVSFKMRNGREYTVPMETLSAQSIKSIKEWWKEASKVVLTSDDRIRITVHTRRDADDTDGGYAGWEDMDEKIQPKCIINNDEFLRSFKNLKATIALIGEDVTDRKKLKVVFKDSFTFDVASNSAHTWQGTPFTLDYLIDDNDSHDDSYGFRYRYYFVVIENPDGSVGHAAASLSKWAREPDLIKKIKTNQVYGRELK
ncbi:MAG TPA: hypothetical protein VJ952_13125 [Opitutales bacterium]|nr:hypothetical protein [Opitutales bacterium]